MFNDDDLEPVPLERHGPPPFPTRGEARTELFPRVGSALRGEDEVTQITSLPAVVGESEAGLDPVPLPLTVQTLIWRLQERVARREGGLD